MLRRYAENIAHYGAEMWLHTAHVEELTAADVPTWPRHQLDAREAAPTAR